MAFPSRHTNCEQWDRSLEAFLQHREPRSTPKYDNAGNYKPDNWKWLKGKKYIVLQRNGEFITVDGISTQKT
jgi:hypothetical protein